VDELMRKGLFIIAIAIMATGCGGEATNKNANATNVNTPVKNSNNPLAVTTPTPESTTNNAPTLTPVYKAYCDAMAKKDEAGLRKVFSSDTVKTIEASIKEDGIKPPTLVKYFEDEQVTTALCEVRNEQINGNEAVAEVRTNSTPNGVKIIFVKEGNDWKLTNRFPTLKK
jgi:hypothetical protein